MVKNLFDFADTPIQPKKNVTQNVEDLKDKLNQSGIDADDVEKTYKKYQNMSQNELIAEFVKQAKSQRQQGVLDDNKLQNMVSNISPFLNEQQREFLNTLIHKIDE